MRTTLSEMIKLLGDNNSDVISFALKAIAEIFKSLNDPGLMKTSLSEMINLLGHNDSDVRYHAVEAIAGILK